MEQYLTMKIQVTYVKNTQGVSDIKKE